MLQGIDIRRGTASDCETIVDLLVAQLREHRINTPREAVGHAVEGLLADAGRGFTLIALQGARAVGVADVSFVWTLEHGGHSAWLDELYVVPHERNRGIGEALLAAVLEETSAAGCLAVDLEVDSAQARAEHLYARNGFMPLSRKRWVRALKSGVEDQA